MDQSQQSRGQPWAASSRLKANTGMVWQKVAAWEAAYLLFENVSVSIWPSIYAGLGSGYLSVINADAGLTI
jgi:hypothetical protein